MYLSKYEDTVLVIDSRAIEEIPLIWQCNENLKIFHNKNSVHEDDMTDNSEDYDETYMLTFDDFF